MHIVYNVEKSNVLINIKTKYYYIENRFYTERLFYIDILCSVILYYNFDESDIA